MSGTLISQPYIALTLAQMQRFGVVVEHDSWQRFTLPAQQYYRSPGHITVEGDASSASYFLAAGAIGGGPVRVLGVGSESAQGDVRFVDALEKMGAHVSMSENWIESDCILSNQFLRAIDLDCNHIPDAAMTLAVVALFAKGVTTLRNIASWRLKETDRLAAMTKELQKLGARIEVGEDYLRINPPENGLTPMLPLIHMMTIAWRCAFPWWLLEPPCVLMIRVVCLKLFLITLISSVELFSLDEAIDNVPFRRSSGNRD